MQNIVVALLREQYPLNTTEFQHHTYLIVQSKVPSL